jgi:hypothetical protein
VSARDGDVAYDRGGLPHVVDDDDRLRQHEPEIGHAGLVRVRVGHAFDEAHPVVADHADRAAEEARQLRALERDRAQRGELRAQELERVAGRAHAFDAAVLFPLHVGAARAEQRARAGADEAESAPLLAALDRLEQEARVSVVELAE